MIATEAPSYRVDIFIGGARSDANRICRRHCWDVGLCVSIVDCDFVYTGGAESGVRVGLINYPRFPLDRPSLFDRALALAKELMDGLCQRSCTVQGDDRTVWLSRPTPPEAA